MPATNSRGLGLWEMRQAIYDRGIPLNAVLVPSNLKHLLGKPRIGPYNQESPHFDPLGAAGGVMIFGM